MTETTIAKERKIRLILVIALVLLAALSAYLLLSLNQRVHQVGELQNSLMLLMDYSRGKEERLSQVEGDLARLQQEYQALTEQLHQVDQEKGEALDLADLYQAQKYYFLDVMDWLGTQLGYRDVERSARAYSALADASLPESCVPADWTRYERWARPLSTLYMASPQKMGWSPYVNWSIREDVVFDRSHIDAPGYVGSRGYEFRYPLVPGTFPQQEIHTTLSAFEHPVADETWMPDEAERVVDLMCGLKGYVVTRDDPDETKTLHFGFGNFVGNMKIKYHYNDFDAAVEILIWATNLVIQDLMAGY